MSSLFFGSRKPYNKYGVLSYQQKLLQEQYSFLQCSIQNNVLICIGWLQPEHCKQKYKIKMEYVAGSEPKSSIISPKIEPSRGIHMYNDQSLCLHYPADMKWNERIKIHQYTVPWISEWIVFYEIYLLNGNKWEGKESPTHFTEEDKNRNKDHD